MTYVSRRRDLFRLTVFQIPDSYSMYVDIAKAGTIRHPIKELARYSKKRLNVALLECGLYNTINIDKTHKIM